MPTRKKTSGFARALDAILEFLLGPAAAYRQPALVPVPVRANQARRRAR